MGERPAPGRDSAGVPDRLKPGRRLWALAAIVLALGLLTLALPRVQASLIYLPVDTAISRYFRERTVPSAQLDALRAQARAAIERHPHYRYYEGLSLLNYLQAIDLVEKPWLQRPALVRAERAGLETVRRAPARPGTWLRIARARAALGRPPETVAEPLEMSILAGRVEPSLLLPRLELGYAHVDYFDAETRSLLRDQTLLAWRTQERAFRRALNADRLDLSRIESVLGSQNTTILREMGAER
ncbi:MAG: hypothetical protein AAGH19_04130 [Pseudomonadota bacterium]